MSTDSDTSVYEAVKDVLGLLSEFTAALSGEKEVTISCVQPVLWKIFAVLAVSANNSNRHSH